MYTPVDDSQHLFARSLPDNEFLTVTGDTDALVIGTGAVVSSLMQLPSGTLFMDNSTSPDGHLISMVVALNQGDRQTARRHFNAYLKSGHGRSDYDNIREYYSFLNH